MKYAILIWLILTGFFVSEMFTPALSYRPTSYYVIFFSVWFVLSLFCYILTKTPPLEES